jgi:TolB-like protein/Tfp pilus assembly protein PilF
MNEFFQRLRQRKLVQWAIAYVAAAFAFLQGIDIIGQQFGWPDSVRRGITLALVIGFFVTLVLAWYHGERGAQRVTGTELLIIGLVLAVGGGLLWRLAVSRSEGNTSAKPNERNREVVAPIPAKSIAVLPFENLSSDKENAYFADGIQDEILTRLATIADLKVISRTSTTRYKSNPEDLKNVSQQLGVANILEGSVQKSGDKVRVNIQLIDARSDSHLWARSYDGDARDIFGMETEVSQQVADALRVRLSPAETQKLAGGPTANTEAYDLFLKAEFEEREAESSLKADDYDRAAALYRKALDLEPKFALARARLVMNRMQRHWYIDHLSDAELQPIQDEADRALELAPNLPEAHIARGVVYYFGHRQYEEALAEFAAAIRLQPNNARALEFRAYVQRRLGRWKESLADLKASLEQDPRNSNLHAEIAVSYGYLRMWKETRDFAQRALAINPHEVAAIAEILASALSGKGDVAEATQLLATVPGGNFLLPDFSHAGGQGMIGYRALIALLNHDTNAALEVLGDGTALDERRRLCARVVILILSNENARARSEAEKALSQVETKLRERPNDLDAIAEASWIYLGLDRSDDAIAMAKRAVDLLPPEKDALVGPVTLVNLAQIECRAGHAAEAIEILRRLLSIPAGAQLSIPTLRIHPVWDPIRNEAAFQRLLTVQQRVGP